MSAQFRDDERIETLRVPPHSNEAEQSVLGGLILAADAMVQVSDWLAPEDFYRRDHRLIYTAMQELQSKKIPFDIVTLGEWFDVQGLTDQIGRGYLIELVGGTVSAANILAYAEIIVDKSRMRKAIQIGSDLVTAGFQPDGRDVAEIVHTAHTELMHLAPTPRTGPKASAVVLKSFYDDLKARYESDKLPGLPTPWLGVNDATHGWQDDEVYLIAARTTTGKSKFGFQAAAFNALRGNRTLKFSLEMSAEAVMRRNVSALAGIPHDWLLMPRDPGPLDMDRRDHWSAVTKAYRQLAAAPLLIDDTAGLSTAQIVARAQREHLRAPLRMVLVDHLHDIKLPGKQNETIERADALRDLKALAKVLHCPVIVLAQLNRNSDAEKRRPVMRDLRGSGGIEEVADVILFLYAPDGQQEGKATLVECIVGKGRDIRRGEPINLKASADVMRLDDWSGELPELEAEPKRARHKQADTAWRQIGGGADRASRNDE